ncbi:putative reverse transcriptase domain-containing protein [Tanacetum coccineum]
MASSYEREAVYARQAWSRSEDRSTALEASIRTLEAQVRTLQTQHDMMEWQRQDAGDLVTTAFGRIHALEAETEHAPEMQDTRMDQLMLKMPPKKTTTPMTDASIKALIAQGVVDALAEYEAHRSSDNGNDSHDSGSGRRTERTTREMFLEESDEVEKYVGGLPDMIQGSVMASKPKIMQDAIEFATKLMDQKIRTFAERKNMVDLYLCTQNATTITMGSVLLGATTARKLTIWPVTIKGHLKKDCPKLKNKNSGNQYGNGGATSRAYVVGFNVVTSTFLLNNRYASILFDTGADRSFVSSTFSSIIDIVPTAP